MRSIWKNKVLNIFSNTTESIWGLKIIGHKAQRLWQVLGIHSLWQFRYFLLVFGFLQGWLPHCWTWGQLRWQWCSQELTNQHQWELWSKGHCLHRFRGVASCNNKKKKIKDVFRNTFFSTYTHLPLTENRLKFFDRTNPTNNYESTYIWWYEIIKIILFCQTLFEKTHISVILYYKIDQFCPLKSSFHQFFGIWPNVWVCNSLLHSLVQVRHARSLFFPFWHQ